MQIEQNLWTLALLGKNATVSPYVFFNGIGFIMGILLLDRNLISAMPKKQNAIYCRFVLSIVIGWTGAHILDWTVRDISFSQAGFTFLGGLVSGSLFYLWATKNILTLNELWTSMNCAVVPLIVGQSIGRFGCFFGGCCYGKHITTSSHLAPFFINHPTQLYEAGFLSIVAIFLFSLREKCFDYSLIIYLFAYGIFRFFIEFLRADDRGIFILSTSQWICMGLILLATSILFFRWKINFTKTEKTECG